MGFVVKNFEKGTKGTRYFLWASLEIFVFTPKKYQFQNNTSTVTFVMFNSIKRYKILFVGVSLNICFHP